MKPTDGKLIGPKDGDAIIDAINRKDDFAVVVRGTAVLETAMNEAIAAAFTLDNAIYRTTYLSWQSLVRLCVAAGMLNRTLLAPLERLGRLRNRYAHEHDYHAKIGDVEYDQYVKTDVLASDVFKIGGQIRYGDTPLGKIVVRLLPLLLQVDTQLTAYLRAHNRLPEILGERDVK